MKKLIAATTFSVLMAAGGALAQTYDSTGASGMQGGGAAPATTYDSMQYGAADDMGIDMGVDTTSTGSINPNSNCTPPNGTNPANIPAEQQAPVVQSCNPR
jgi:hypothetical protein